MSNNKDIRAALERLVARLRETNGPDEPVPAWLDSYFVACAVLAAEPLAPEADAALSLAAIIRSVDGSHSLGAAALAEAILSHPNAASVFQPPAPDHIPDATKMVPAADGEREELADRLGWIAAQLADIGWGDDSASVARAADLLRQPVPAQLPVPVAKRPWERPGWCDADGRCWWGRCADEFFSPEWVLGTNADVEEFCSDAMPQICLPHWAIPIPQPPQGGEVER